VRAQYEVKIRTRIESPEERFLSGNPRFALQDMPKQHLDL
jgi:hypothetical protein